MWSIVLLLLFKVAYSIVLSQMLHQYIIDESNDLAGRRWINDRYGDFFKTLYSMFEITYSGSWPSLVRPVLDYAGHWYAPVFLLYVTFVVFAVIRIITALFLKETLECAQADLETQIEEKRLKAESYYEKLEALFFSMDANGDGTLSVTEMEDALQDDRFARYMDLLELKISDVEPLFRLLDDGDGMVTIAEFCYGMNHIKGGARSYDVMRVLHEQSQLKICCHELGQQLDGLKWLVTGTGLLDNVLPPRESTEIRGI